jgi:NAD(P)H dehydrogenase (quinone)
MTTAVIGATGRVGSAVVERLLAGDQRVIALVRDGSKAVDMFGAAAGLDVREVALDQLPEVVAGIARANTVFVAMGSIGEEGVLQRVAIQAAATSSIDQFVRLSVLNASPTSLGINQRAHWSIDAAATAAGVPYTTVRPAIFSASLLVGADEVQASRTWTGIASTGRVALIDHRDVADVCFRILTDPTTWGRHHDVTGPTQLSWPEAMDLLSGELNETVTFQTTAELPLIRKLIDAGVAPGQAELLVAREWAIIAGENERTTPEVRALTGHEPRTVADFLSENLVAFKP